MTPPDRPARVPVPRTASPILWVEIRMLEGAVIEVKVVVDKTRLWQNWGSGLHRQTCYGDVTRELGYFRRFNEINLVNEAV